MLAQGCLCFGSSLAWNCTIDPRVSVSWAIQVNNRYKNKCNEIQNVDRAREKEPLRCFTKTRVCLSCRAREARLQPTV